MRSTKRIAFQLSANAKKLVDLHIEGLGYSAADLEVKPERLSLSLKSNHPGVIRRYTPLLVLNGSTIYDLSENLDRFSDEEVDWIKSHYEKIGVLFCEVEQENLR